MICLKEKGTANVALAASTKLKIANTNCFLYGFKKGTSAAKVRNPRGFVLLLWLVIEESLIIIYDSSLRLELYF